MEGNVQTTKFNAVNQASIPERSLENTPAPVGQTVMVGMGGTGKEVLLRLRRLIVERYGSIDALPCIQFLHLDTDQTPQAMQQYDKTMDGDPLYSKVAFSPSERINLVIEGGAKKYLSNMNSFPHIREWFNSKGKIADLGDLGEGAGQIRMASRLAFFEKYHDIVGGIENAKRHLLGESIRFKVAKLGFEYEPTLTNIYVISSLAGGTGSGTFLDMGFLLKEIFKGSTRVGIFFLPSFFNSYAGAERMKANGYAALMELNHYSFGNSFVGNWSGQEPVESFPPPFDYTYLLEGQNEANEGIGSKGEEYSMYQMVAEIIFQEFTQGDFAGLKRAIRVNLKNFIDNACVHEFWKSSSQIASDNLKGDTYTTRFCSFGLSAITFPVERVHRACACRLAKNILEHWQQNVIDQPLDILFTSFLTAPEINFVQGEYTKLDGTGSINQNDVEKALLWYNKEAGKDFLSYIWDKARKIRTELEQVPDDEKHRILSERRHDIEKLMAKEDSDNPDEWGTDVRIIHSNMKRYLENLKEGIQKRAKEMANESKYGISYALSMLQEMKKLLKNDLFNYIPYFDGSLEKWNSATEQYHFQLEQLHLDLSKHARQILFRKADVANDIEQLVAAEPDEDFGILYNYLYARVMKQVAKRGRTICEEIDKYLGDDHANGKGLIAKYHQLTRGLNDIRDRLSEKEKYYSTKVDYATIKTLYKEGDIDEWYNIWLGSVEEEQSQNLIQVSKQILSTIFKVDSVTEALQFIQNNSNEVIEEQVMNECRKFFENHENQPSALEMLMDDRRCSIQERRNLIQASYKRAKVWLKPTVNVDQVQFRVTPYQKPYLIGLDTNDSVRSTEFEDMLKNMQQPGDLGPQIKNIGERKKSSIIFYNELGGATAFYPSSVTEVNGLKTQYDKFCGNPKSFNPENQEDIHIHRNRFQFNDIIPKTLAQVNKYESAIRAFVLAKLLGILKVFEDKNDDGSVTNIHSYEYQQTDIITDEVDLGDDYASVDILYRDPSPEYESHRKKLFDQIEKVIELLKERKLIHVYHLLIDFYLEHVYPTMRTGDETTNRKKASPFHAALEYERNIRIPEELLSDIEYKQLKNALNRIKSKFKSKKLSYDEYNQALSSFIMFQGKYKVTKKTTFGTEFVLKKIPVLDIDRILKKRTEKDEDVRMVQTKKKAVKKGSILTSQKRPCPNCENPINVRAIKCIHCKEVVAKQIECENCAAKLPDDLEECWNCGITIDHGIDEAADDIECEGCFEYTGPISESSPCPNCSWYPGQEVVYENQYEQKEEEFSSHDEISDDNSYEYEEIHDTTDETDIIEEIGEVEELDEVDEVEDMDEVDEVNEVNEMEDNYQQNVDEAQHDDDADQQQFRTRPTQQQLQQIRPRPKPQPQARIKPKTQTKHHSSKTGAKATSQHQSRTKPNAQKQQQTRPAANEQTARKAGQTTVKKPSQGTQRVTQQRETQTANKVSQKPIQKTETQNKKAKAKPKAQNVQEVLEVECPTCFEIVPKGPVCAKCGEYL